MDKIVVTTLNEDGSIAFSGTFNKDQVSFILQVGVNYLMSQGALAVMEDADDDEDDWPEPNAPSSDKMQ